MNSDERDQAIDQICEAFGVTWEEVEALDRAMGGPQQRAERERFEKVILPRRIKRTLKEINKHLPPGTTFSFNVNPKGE